MEPLGVFSMIVELTVTITGEEERSAEELIWTCLFFFFFACGGENAIKHAQ